MGDRLSGQRLSVFLVSEISGIKFLSGLVGQAFPLAAAGRNACPVMPPRIRLTVLIVSTLEERHLVGMGDQPTIKIESVTQLAVFLSNRPGALARVCEELAGAEINIHALSISDTADHSVVRMAVSDPTKALMLLGERGVLALETEVLMIETENHPGVLGQMAHRLADAEVNIEYAYMAATLNSAKGLMILRPDDVEKAQQVLRGL
jgi:hypothetical protein